MSIKLLGLGTIPVGVTNGSFRGPGKRSTDSISVPTRILPTSYTNLSLILSIFSILRTKLNIKQEARKRVKMEAKLQ